MQDKPVRRNIRLLAWFNFLLDFRLYAPIMVIYFELITDSYALAMSVLSVTMLSSALLEVPTGIFSDRVGRRYTIITGAVASLFSVTCYAIGGTYGVLILGGIGEGLGRSLFSGNNDALLYDTLTDLNQNEEYQHRLGHVSSAYQFALAVSAFVGGLIAAISFPLVMWLSVIPKVFMVILSFYFIEPRLHLVTGGNLFTHLKTAMKFFIRNPRLRLVATGQMIGASVGEAAFLFRTVFIEMLWPLWAIGAARMISNISASVSFFFAGDLLKRFGEKKLLLGGISLSEVTNLTALVLQSVVSPVMMGATSIFFGVNTVSMNGMMQREFTDEQRSTMGSLAAFGGSILFAILSVFLGWLADVIGVRDALIVATLMSSTSLFFFYQVFHNQSDEMATDEESGAQ